MISQLIVALRNLHLEPTDEDIADIFWLALHIGPIPVASEISDWLSHQANESNNGELEDESSTFPSAKGSPFFEKKGELYPALGESMGEDGIEGMLPFKAPSVPALPEKLALGRALRPLMRKVSSHIRSIIDEALTAQFIAEEGLWLPVMIPARERWLEVALVIDESRSMAIWWHSIAELQLLLERLGAFRDVRIWELFTDEKGEKARLRMGSGRSALGQPARPPSELLDPSGRRLILMISDCVKQAWYNGTIVSILAIWGRRNPVALIQVLPQALWRMTALGDADAAFLRARVPGQANSQLACRLVSDRVEKEELRSWLLLPTVTLEPSTLTDWALSLTGSLALKRSEQAWTRGYVFDTRASRIVISAGSQENQEVNLGAEDRLKRFYATVSPIARKLAGLLAATPITLPIIRLIQQTMLPKSQLSHIAEVFLSGLLEQLPTQSNVDPDDIQYDFSPGIRELLLDSQPTNDSAQVLVNISTFIEDHMGQYLDFRALLADPSSPLPLEIITGNSIRRIKPFAMIGAMVLRRLGGRYAQIAVQLEQKVESIHLPPIGEDLHPLPEQVLDISEVEESSLSSSAFQSIPDSSVNLRFDFSAYVAEHSKDFVGREWVFREIQDWLAKPKAARNFILTGEPGIGKTAIAAQLTKYPLFKPAASYFCITQRSETLNPFSFIQALANQLTSLPGFAEALQSIHISGQVYVEGSIYGQATGVRIDQLALQAPSALSVFHRVVIEPLKLRYANGFTQPVVILVDALDEAANLPAPETIIDLLVNAQEVPESVRFIVTSRSNSVMLDVFENLSSYILQLRAEGVENQRDVRNYISHKIESSPFIQVGFSEQGITRNAFIEYIAKKSQFNLLNTAFLLKELMDGTLKFEKVAHEIRVDSSTIRKKVFIAYSHADVAYLKRLQQHLKPYMRSGSIQLWDDTQIKPGSNWREELERAIESARVAILLVSANFLASDFIIREELPKLLAATKDESMRILPVIVSACDFANTALTQFQPVNSPIRPLNGLKPHERDEIWVQVVSTILESLSPGSASIDSLNEVRQKVLRILYEGRGDLLQALEGEDIARLLGKPWHEIKTEVAYLEEQGFVAAKSRNMRNRIFQFFTITPAGIDFVEHDEERRKLQSSSATVTEKILQPIYAFISAPGDLNRERDAAKRVIQRCNALDSISRRYVLKPLLYEELLPPEVGQSPQATVDKYMVEADNADIFICILSQRMGTPVIDNRTGETYNSAAEYEFLHAYQANQKHGKPHILLYRGLKPLPVDHDQEQWDQVNTFFKRFEGLEAEYKGIYRTFRSTRQFEDILFQDLNTLISHNFLQ